MNKKIKLQFIGSYLEGISSALKSMGILTESCIGGCSPLSMVGDTNQKYVEKYAAREDVPMPDVLSLKKNLGNMLSRSSDSFCQNYNKQPMGTEVRTANSSDYLVFMNSASEISLFKKGSVIFSSMRTAEITKAFENDKEYQCIWFPFSGDFNWKYYYDKFIDVILKEYDSSHIILIKTNSAQWYMDGKDIRSFEKRSVLFRNMINQMDEYFIERTKCQVINEHFNHIPEKKIDWMFPYVIMSKNTSECLANEINNVIVSNTNEDYVPKLPKYGTNLTRFIQRKLSSEIFEKNEKYISFISENWLAFNEIKKKNEKEKCDFLEDLIRLEQFLDPSNEYALSDYVIQVSEKKEQIKGNDELFIAELYTRYFKLDINDVIAVYMLSEQYENKSVFKDIVKNILNNKECYPVCAARSFKNKNIGCLREYPYISEKEFSDVNRDIYVCLENNCWLVLNPYSDTPIRKFDFNVPNKLDFEKIISDGYVCTIESADALTYSYDYYIEKARCGDGAKPTYLKFRSKEEFYESLNYIDYSALLENEKFVFDISEGGLSVFGDYKPIVNLTELLDPDLVTVKVEAGLGDQLGCYVHGQLIASFFHKRIIYDDLFFILDDCFAGFELPKFATVHLNLLSKKLSPRLWQSDIFNKLYKKISPNYIYLSNFQNRLANAKGAMSIMFGYSSSYWYFASLNLKYKYYSAIFHCEDLKKEFKYNIHDFVSFPPFENEYQKVIAQKIISSDSVAVHIRRGDYITYYKKLNQPQLDYGFYLEAIQKIMRLTQYANKKFFIFSDDITWCKTHRNELGLNNVENCEVIFVDANKGDESYRDMQLMALSKMLICGQSGFSRFAAHYNDNLEILISYSINFQKLYETYIRKNKYDIGEIIHTQQATLASSKNTQLQ